MRRAPRPRHLRQIATIVVAIAPALWAQGCRQAPASSSNSRPRPSADTAPQASRPEPSLPVDVLTAAEKTAVQEFLRLHPDLRQATDADRQIRSGADSDVRHLYGIYHPYFVRGDVNDDGILDFVLAFVHREAGRGNLWFSIVVFTGRGGDKGFDAGTFLERDISLARGDLSVDRDAILITPDLSDEEAVRRYRWDPIRRAYVFLSDDPEEVERPVLSQT
jgi:hypothetical protein